LHITALGLIHRVFQCLHLLLRMSLCVVQRVGLRVCVGGRVLQLVRARQAVRWVTRDRTTGLRGRDTHRTVDGRVSTCPQN
jgi:hypothetical protein